MSKITEQELIELWFISEWNSLVFYWTSYDGYDDWGSIFYNKWEFSLSTEWSDVSSKFFPESNNDISTLIRILKHKK
jgi:hypothetical protein